MTFAKSLTSDLVDTDKGILFNLKNLTINPGNSINDYIDGKRKNIFNPFSYALIAVTAYLLISKYFGIENILKEDDIKEISYQPGFDFGKEVGYFIGHYIKYFFLLHILYLSLTERLFFDKRNLFEIITMNAFIVGHAVIIGLIFYPILKFPIIYDPVVLISIIMLSFFTFKKHYSKAESIFIPIFSLFISIILMFLIPLVVFYIIKNIM